MFLQSLTKRRSYSSEVRYKSSKHVTQSNEVLEFRKGRARSKFADGIGCV